MRPTPTSPARVALARSIDTLQDLRLISKLTQASDPVLQLLDERGNGRPYVHPARAHERYLTLPHAYWYQGYDLKLNLAGKATLLISRSLRPDTFTLPLVNAPIWYGLSADTLRRGMQQLVRLHLASYVPSLVESNTSPAGKTVRRHYTLKGVMVR